MTARRLFIPPPPRISVADEAYVVFVDLLGFSALTEAFPHSTIREVLSEVDDEIIPVRTGVQADLFATRLMGNFIRRFVPVRMGFAGGTCDAVRFSSDTVGQFHMNRAVFAGTAIVRASEVEKKGGKGCRIFVHSRVSDE